MQFYINYVLCSASVPTSVASSGRSNMLDGGQGVYYAASLCRLQWLAVAMLDGGQGVYYAASLCRLQWLAVAALTCWMVDKVCIMQRLCADKWLAVAALTCWMVDKVCIMQCL